MDLYQLGDFSFKKEERLLKRSEFLYLFKYGKRLYNQYFIANFQKKCDNNRLGVTVSKKVGNAATRNRIKRLIREYYRLNKSNMAIIGLDINIIAKQQATKLSSEQFFVALEDIFNKISRRLNN